MSCTVLSLGLISLSLDAIARTPFLPHHREGHDDRTSRPHRRRGAGGCRSPHRSRRMAGQAVLTPPAPPRPSWSETRPLFPLEVPVPSVTTVAVMLGRA